MDGLAAEALEVVKRCVGADRGLVVADGERGEDGLGEGEAAVNEGRRARGGEGKDFNSGAADSSHSGG